MAERNMPGDTLRNHVLRCADEDPNLSDDARLVVLAALGDPGDLDHVLGTEPAPTALVDALRTPSASAAQPVGAFLRSITVRGFRGIGPEVTLPLPPGPGLVVVAGRNGSGKSTLAEALELALTGSNSRWKGKPVIWTKSWRNLHAGDPAMIRIGLTEDGEGTTTIGVDWPSGAEDVSDTTRWVQRAGCKRHDTAALGWESALEMYRPLLSYDELGGILEGRPSDFYDELHKLLGLEQLTQAIARLDGEVKRLRVPAGESRAARDRVRPLLETHGDARAATALAQVKKLKPDLDVVRPLITHGPAAAVPSAWQQAQRLTAPTAQDVLDKCVALRSAAASERDEVRRSDAVAADRAALLAHGIDFHDTHGERPCPVCGQGTLDERWAVAARAALERAQSAGQQLTAARAATQQARSALIGLIRGVPRPPLHAPELDLLDAARAAYDQFADYPDDDLALADHAERTRTDLDARYADLRQQADALIQNVQDAWSPVAVELADWLKKAETARAADPALKVATMALKWMQANAGSLRNQRIAPLTGRAEAIWAALRQESNVSLGGIRLEGQRTTRRVVLEAAVDGSASEAFGVMSQGELQALALAIFIPRATSPESPFRFVVLDDPIQAMDPSKIDGFLDILVTLAKDRQVVVFTHDDRLPTAIRRSRAPARIVEVTRGAQSAVRMAESSKPALRLLADAFAIAADAAVPVQIKRTAIPVLCREALEATAWDVFVSKAAARGHPYAEAERRWEAAGTVRKRVALALALDADDMAAVDKWRSGGPARRGTMHVVNSGLHTGVTDFRSAVNDARRTVDDLARLAT